LPVVGSGTTAAVAEIPSDAQVEPVSTSSWRFHATAPVAALSA
jgi:hypothetical protein